MYGSIIWGCLMREIKFRGKSLDYWDWVRGYYVYDEDANLHFIVDWSINDRKLVDPTTVDQFTGLLDKNGQEIYENDVVAITRWDGFHIVGEDIGTLKWHEESSAFKWFRCDPRDENNYQLKQSQAMLFTIKGNITDNPELMEGK